MASDPRPLDQRPDFLSGAELLLRPEKVSIHSSSSQDSVLDALRKASEGGQSTVSAIAWAAGIGGWTVRVKGYRVLLRPRPRGRGTVLKFVGTVEPSGSGSAIQGELRLYSFTRIFFGLWITLAALSPVVTLVEPFVDDIGIRLLVALFMIVPATALATFGLWYVAHSSKSEAEAIKELLRGAAGPRRLLAP